MQATRQNVQPYHSVCPLFFLLLGEGWGGEGLRTKFSKGLTGSQFLEGVCWERRGDLFQVALFKINIIVVHRKIGFLGVS